MTPRFADQQKGRGNTGTGEQGCTWRQAARNKVKGVALQDKTQKCLVCAILRHDLDVMQILESTSVRVFVIRKPSAFIHSASMLTEPEYRGVSVCPTAASRLPSQWFLCLTASQGQQRNAGSCVPRHVDPLASSHGKERRTFIGGLSARLRAHANRSEAPGCTACGDCKKKYAV